MLRKRVVPGLLIVLAVLWAVWWFGFHGQPLGVIFFPPPDEAPYPAALDELAEIDVREVPLQDALQRLARRYHVEIVLDQDSLRAAELTGREPVTGQLAGVPLRTILELLVQQADERLMIGIRGGRLHLTTASAWYRAETNYEARIYWLTALLAVAGGVGENELADLVGRVGPRTAWPPGGLGVVRPLPGALVVGQTPEVHRQIERLLTRLTASYESCSAPAPLDLSDPDPEASAAVARALDGDVELDLRGTRLDDALNSLGEHQRIPVWLDVKALTAMGLQPAARLTRRLPRIPLRSALQLALHELELTYSVRGGALLVTTTERPQEESVRLYPVADLDGDFGGVPDPDEMLATASNFPGRSLATTTFSVVRRGMWSNVLRSQLIGEARGFLVVSEPWDVQQEVERFLDLVRQAKQPTLDAPPGSRDVILLDSCPRIEHALAQEVSLSFHDIPLHTVARDLERRFHIPVRITPPEADPFAPLLSPSPAGRTASPHASLPTDYQADHVPLAVALREMLRPLKLDFHVRHQTVWFTSVAEEGGPGIAETRLYRVRKFPAGDPQAYGVRDVIEVARALLNPKNWEASARVLSGQDLVFVTQPRPIHERFSAILQGLEQSRSGLDQPDPIVLRGPQGGPLDEIRIYPLAPLRLVKTRRSAGRGTASQSLATPGNAWYNAWQTAAQSKPGRGSQPHGPTKTSPPIRGFGMGAAGPAANRSPPGLEAGASEPESVVPWSRPDGPCDAWTIGELVRTVVRPLGWESSARPEPATMSAGTGRADAGVLTSLPGMLLVRQQAEVHEEICRLLEFLASPAGLPASSGPTTRAVLQDRRIGENLSQEQIDRIEAFRDRLRGSEQAGEDAS